MNASAVAHVSDFFALTPDQQRGVLAKLNESYGAIEKERPGAGYKIRICGASTGSPMAAHLDACGTREKSTPMAMPRLKTTSCVFCSIIARNEQFQGLAEPLNSQARVIRSLQGNALIVSATHRGHWFEHTVSEQQAMLTAAGKVMRVLAKGGHFNYELVIDCGTHGNQRVPHTHVHILIGRSAVLEQIDQRVATG
jgi:diadenosine tetraphosphate (Ap4A) HIT family hydrolase